MGLSKPLFFMKKPYKTAIALTWFLFINYLFFIPGSALPSDDWMDKIWLDKWVHIAFFSLLSFLWCWSLVLRKKLLLFFGLTVFYGLLVEVCQHQFVSNRSFDLLDLVADSIGSSVGILVWRKKNKPL